MAPFPRVSCDKSDAFRRSEFSRATGAERAAVWFTVSVSQRIAREKAPDPSGCLGASAWGVKPHAGFSRRTNRAVIDGTRCAASLFAAFLPSASARRQRNCARFIARCSKWLASAFLSAAILAASLPSLAGETIEILLAHDQLQVPANTPQALVAREFRHQVDQLSKGRIKIDILPNAMLGGNLDVVRLVDKNVLHSAMTPIGAVAAVFPPLRATLIPFAFERIETARKVMSGPYRRHLAAAMDSSVNLHLLGFVDAGGFDILTNLDREIETPDDMWGLNLASFPDLPELDDMIKATGAKAVKVSMRERINALSSHALDGQMGTIDMAMAQGLPAIQGHATLTNHLYAPYAWVFSKTALEALAPEDREIIVKAAEAALAKALEHIQANERAQTLLKILAQSMKVRSLSLGGREKFRSVMQPAAEAAVIESLGSEGERLVRDFKAAIRDAEGR